ncbi:MAG: NF038122 family metalloprotease [Rivularia sp. (in: Bacteria)]|nr:NF038122 family metalloprotease [Rivularia sp. MS3]
MKNNFISSNNKLFSTSKFILQILLYVSTTLIATTFSATAFGLEIDKSVNIDTEFSNLELDLDINSLNLNLDTTDISFDSDLFIADFNYQYNHDLSHNSSSSSQSGSSESIIEISPLHPSYTLDLPQINSTTSLPSPFEIPDSSITDTDLSNLSNPIKRTNLDNTNLKFNFTYDSNVSDEQIMGFEMAGKFWSNYLTDDVNLNIHITSTDELPENVIGGALPGMKSFNYNQVRTHLEQDMNQLGNSNDPYLNSLLSDDFSAVNSLNEGNTGENYHVMVNGKEITGVNRVNMTRANAKALGLISGEDADLDGLIVFSNLNNLTGNSSWDYGFKNHQVADDKLDFFSMAVHELGHIMGFVSSGDNSNFRNTINQSKISNQKVEAQAINQSITLLDLFRYSDVSKEFVHSVDGKQGIADLSIGGNPFLSSDRGLTKIADLSSGEDSSLGGDGYQASHWKQNDNVLGIMDPLLGLGKKRKTTYNDRNAMDILGWDLDISTGFDMLAGMSGDMSEIPVITDINGNVIEELTNDIELFLQEIFSYADTSFKERVAFARVAPDSTDISETINQMLEDSDDFYKWGWGVGYSQKFSASNMSPLWQNMSWQKVDLNTSSSLEVKSTPESGSLLGLLGLGLFGIIYRSQGFLGRKRNLK